ncbi:hypothetical protein HK099_008377, partial [Clydaea vesicula]
MSYIYITGNVEDLEFTKAEMLGNYLSYNLDNFCIKVEPIKSELWPEHRKKIHKENNWEKRPAYDR